MTRVYVSRDSAALAVGDRAAPLGVEGWGGPGHGGPILMRRAAPVERPFAAVS